MHSLGAYTNIKCQSNTILKKISTNMTTPTWMAFAPYERALRKYGVFLNFNGDIRAIQVFFHCAVADSMKDLLVLRIQKHLLDAQALSAPKAVILDYVQNSCSQTSELYIQ